MSRIVDEAVARYRRRIGDRRAYQEDPQYRMQLDWLRTMLAVIDMAMEDEDIPEMSRERVIRTALYGGPDPVDAERRIDLRAEEVERLSKTPVFFPVRADESLPPNSLLLVPPRLHDETAEEHARRCAATTNLGDGP